MSKHYIKRERGTALGRSKLNRPRVAVRHHPAQPPRRLGMLSKTGNGEQGEVDGNLNFNQLLTLFRRLGIGDFEPQSLENKKMRGGKIPFAFRNAKLTSTHYSPFPLPSSVKTKANKNIQLPIQIFFKYLSITSIITCIGLFSGEEVFPAKSTHTPAQLLPSLRSSFFEPKLIYTFKGHTGTIKSLAFGPKGKMLASGGAENDGVIRIWNLKKGKRMGIIRKAHKTAVLSLLISPDGNTLASCSSDNTINLWNLNNLKFTRSFVGHTSNILSLAVSPNSKILVSGALDGIRIWDLLQQRPLGTLTKLRNSVYTVAISPNGQTLASSDERGAIELWDLNSNQLISTFATDSPLVTSVAFTPNGNTLVSASRDARTIQLWNINTGKLTRTLQGNTHGINAIAIDPKGKMMASAGKDGIMLWDLTTGKLLSKLYGHSDWVSTLAWSPDGKMLASGGFDRQVKIWKFQ